MIHFYGYFRSSAAYRCRIAFNLKAVDYDFTSVHLRRNGGEQKQEPYLSLNPQGLVPCIDVDGFVLGQSLAIMEWLDEVHPEPAILPKDVGARAQVRAFAQIIACDIHPLQNLRVLQYLKNEFNCNQAALDAWCQRWLGDGLMACEEILQQRKYQSKFCFGDEPTIADICLVPQVLSADRFNVNLSEMPLVRNVYDSCEAMSEFSKAHPSQQPDMEN